MDYKEKLKLAKEALESGSYDKDTIEYIFPELAESEDERIRKWLIDYFKEVCDNVSEKEKKGVLAWLEKQGKNNIGISEATKQELENNLNKALEKETPESWNEFLEKQCEQKPVEWSEKDEQNYDIILKIICSSNKSENLVNELFNWFKSLKNKVQPEQEWNYNDEIIIETIIQEIEKIPSEKFIDNAKYRCLDWLRYRTKFLRPQNNNVTDKELAQAKKDAYNNALDKIEYYSSEPTFDDGWDAAIWYLKKRNIQLCHTWKPSDEQITWLYRAADDASKDSRMKQVLNNLLSDLKKL